MVFWQRYKMLFCQKLLKNAKNNSKMVKIWRFLWKCTSGSTKIRNFRFLAKNCSKPASSGFWCYQMWISQKKPNLHYFTVGFGIFEQFLVKPHLVTLSVFLPVPKHSINRRNFSNDNLPYFFSVSHNLFWPDLPKSLGQKYEIGLKAYLRKKSWFTIL